MATITESARIIVQSDWDCSLRYTLHIVQSICDT